MMRIGIPVYHHRVSPVLDTARHLRVHQEESQGDPVEPVLIELPGTTPAEQATAIRNAGIDALICGGVSRELAWILNRYRIRVIPWVAGHIDTVVDAYFNGVLGDDRFAMPGCHRRRRHRGQRRGRRNQRNGGIF